MGDAAVRPLQRRLQVAPKALNRIRSRTLIFPMTLTMLNRRPGVAKPRKLAVHTSLVGHDMRLRRDVLLHERKHYFRSPVRDSHSANAPVRLNHSKDRLLLTEAVLPVVLSSDIRLVDLHSAFQLPAVVLHDAPDQVSHSESTLVGEAKLSREFRRRDAVLRDSKKVNGMEPGRKGNTSTMEDRTRERVDMLALRVHVLLPVLDAVIAREVAPPGSENEVQARVIVREILSQGFYGVFAHDQTLMNYPSYVKLRGLRGGVPIANIVLTM